MLIVIDLKCPSCGHREQDYFVKREDRDSVPCPKCSATMKRLPSAPTLDWKLGTDPESFGTLGDKWARLQEQKARRAQKLKEEHGSAS